MPTYDYLCESCGHQFEHFQSITASALRKCPDCGQRKLKRLIGAGAGVIFKGSGFYQTDYPSESYKNGKKNAKSAATSSSTKKSDSKSKDSKPKKPAKATKKSEKKSA